MSTALASATTEVAAPKTQPSAKASSKEKGTAVDMTTTADILRPAQQLEVKSIVLVDNPGRMEGDNKLDVLKHAIEQAGQVVNPITVRPTTEDDGELHGEGKYAVVDGRRRYRCAKSLGFKTVPVVLWTPGKGKDRITTTQGAILANLANRSLTAPEMLKAFLAIAEDMDWDVKVPKPNDKGGVAACGKDVGKLAKFTNLSSATIYRTMRMGLLDDDILKKVHNKVVGADAARDMGDLVASGTLNEEQAKLIFEEALDMKAKKKVDNSRDPKAPDTRSPEVIKREREAFKREKEKRRIAREAAAKAGETVVEEDEEEEVTAPVSKKDMKAAAANLAAAGKLSKKEAEAVAVAAGKGAGISADAKRDAKIIAYLGETLDDLLNNPNRHIAMLAAALGKFMDGELVKPELIKQFEKHCAGADD